MFPNIDVRHLHAVVILAEELNFTRAAQILRISQSALSKQITEVEEQHRLHLFTREKGRIVELTDAGRAFVEEARAALFHAERAIHLAHAAHEGAENVLMIGHSHDADRAWISALFAIRLPLYPKLRVRLVTRSATDLVRSLLAGELNLAFVTAPLEDSQITKVPFARAPLYVALLRSHPAAHKESIALRDLAADDWILPAKNVHPTIRNAILQIAQVEGVASKNGHEVMTAHQSVHLVSEHAGVAILFKPAGLRFHEEGVVIKPLSDSALWFETCLVMRADDTSRLANEFARAFLRRFARQVLPATQMELPLPA
ncbi:MAG: LysR family transcriptional regulator [Edaphobacter sp.]|nr:LysR family transcriptional regulator [Edaphobacter sp.]